jgi:hypothetical protein
MVLLYRKMKERLGATGVNRALVKTERGNRAMWISLFTFAAGAAVCLSIAAVMMQPAGQRTLRG